MSDERVRCAVLGASGYIGQHFVRLLARHPLFAPPVVVASDRSAGRRLSDVWALAEDPPPEIRDLVLEELTAAALVRRKVTLTFSALPSGIAGDLETELSRRGVSVFSNAADHRMDDGVPLLVPEVNAARLSLLRRSRSGILVTNPNCTAAGLTVGLAPILPLLAPRSIHISTYQALSGAGIPGVPSLAITDNVVPFIRGEEEKVVQESARILGSIQRGRWTDAPLRMTAQCARVAVRDGHLEAVTIEARRRPSESALFDAWRSFDPLAGLDLPTAPHPPIILRPEQDRPQPLRDRWAGAPEGARGMAVSIGRVRWEPPFLRFFLLSHNAVRGGAGGSVLNAELAARRGFFDGAPGSRSG